MDWLLPITGLVGTWAFLSVLGSERQRRSQTLDQKLAEQAAKAAELAAAQNPAP